MEDNVNRIVKLFDGGEVYIKDPSLADYESVETARRKAWNKALQDGCKTEDQMIKMMLDNGWWDADKDTQIAELQKEADLLTKTIEEGGIKKSEARANAIRAIRIRNAILEISSDRIKFLGDTIEAAARRAEFDQFVYTCSVYNNDRNKRFFQDFADYLRKKNSADVINISACCSEVIYGMPNLDESPEKQFLKEHGFVDENFRLVNEDGHLVDDEGRLIDDEGRYVKYVDGQAVYVDRDGEELDLPKKPVFLDDEGPKATEKPKRKPRARKPKKAVSVEDTATPNST